MSAFVNAGLYVESGLCGDEDRRLHTRHYTQSESQRATIVEIFTRRTRFVELQLTFESTVHLHTSYRDRIREYTKLYCMRMTMKMWPLALFVFVLAAVPPPYCQLCSLASLKKNVLFEPAVRRFFRSQNRSP